MIDVRAKYINHFFFVKFLLQLAIINSPVGNIIVCGKFPLLVVNGL